MEKKVGFAQKKKIEVRLIIQVDLIVSIYMPLRLHAATTCSSAVCKEVKIEAKVKSHGMHWSSFLSLPFLCFTQQIYEKF